MKVYELLIEKRSHAAKNPKTPVNQYIDDAVANATGTIGLFPNAFVSFTDIEKLGVNPQSQYGTPIGIYAYPASYVAKMTKGGKSMSELPFAGSAPFANIFSVRGNIINIKALQKPDLVQYLKQLATIVSPDKIKAYHKEYTSGERELVSMGGDEDEEADFYKGKSSGGALWYIVLRAAAESGSNATAKSNKLFRQLGIDGILDPGMGIIHPNEKIQLVLFSTSSIVSNKRVRNSYSAAQMANGREKGVTQRAVSKLNELPVQTVAGMVKRYEVNQFVVVKAITDIKKLAHIAVLSGMKTPWIRNEEFIRTVIELDSAQVMRFGALVDPTYALSVLRQNPAVDKEIYRNNDNVYLLGVDNYTKQAIGRVPGAFNIIVSRNKILQDVIAAAKAGQPHPQGCSADWARIVSSVAHDQGVLTLDQYQAFAASTQQPRKYGFEP